ncbi:6-bladed beta-propeller [Desertivirga xinjiangensis]|uniref:6-bladed beta-propeller n=1 Tax=Desertivirga xinjiangensis TaxID=539206 RepID=UPI00210EF247|nr:6-bladed beta-propeller [Pedobacter xinjiangensis]
MEKPNFLLATLVIIVQTVSGQVSQPQMLHIDPSTAIPLRASEAFQEINYIPLQTTKESIFGEIAALTVEEEHFILSDENTNAILIFLKNGEFKGRITRDKNDRKNFFVNKKNKEIIFRKNGKLLFFNFSGELIAEEPDREFRMHADLHYFDRDRIASSLYAVSKKFLPDTIDFEVKLFQKQRLLAGYLPYNMKTAPIQSEDILNLAHSPFYQTGIDTILYYTRPYDYCIYQVTSSDFSKKYEMVFPAAYTLSSSFKSDTLLQGKRFAFLSAHQNLISTIGYPYQVKNILFFKILSWNNRSNSYIYNLKSATLISVKDIQPDNFNYFLPVTDLHDGVGFANHNFLTSDGQYVYTAVSSDILLKYKRNNAKRDVFYPALLKAYLRKASRKDNPVIIQIKPKDNI